MKSLQLHRHVNLLAGFFVASGLIVFGVGGFVFLHQKGLFNLTYTLHASFASGLGLRQGTDVQFNGVKIGRVETVELMPVSAGARRAGHVLLGLTIDRRYREFLTDRSVAYAERDKNLVSDRVINLETPDPGGRRLDNQDTVRVTDARGIETLIGGLTRLLAKVDHLVTDVDEVMRRAGDPNATLGAMLGSRELYDRLLSGVAHADTALDQGQRLLGRADHLGDTLYHHVGVLLARADTASMSLQRTMAQAERLGGKANGIADRGDSVLRRADQVLREGSGKLEQAGDLMDAVSRLWFIRSKLDSSSRRRSQAAESSGANR